MKRFVGFSILLTCMQLLFAVNASAYLDPSAMTYLIQAVAGVVIAGGAAILIYWKKLKLFFKKRKKRAAIKAAPVAAEQKEPPAQPEIAVEASDAQAKQVMQEKTTEQKAEEAQELAVVQEKDGQD